MRWFKKGPDEKPLYIYQCETLHLVRIVVCSMAWWQGQELILRKGCHGQVEPGDGIDFLFWRAGMNNRRYGFWRKKKIERWWLAAAASSFKQKGPASEALIRLLQIPHYSFWIFKGIGKCTQPKRRSNQLSIPFTIFMWENTNLQSRLRTNHLEMQMKTLTETRNRYSIAKTRQLTMNALFKMCNQTPV